MSDSRPSGKSHGEPITSSGDSAFAHLLQFLPATLWTTDERMSLTFVEGALIRTLRVEPSRILGRTLPDLLLDGREDHPLIQAHITALGGHETTVRIEWGGNLYSARVAPIKDAAGAVTGCVGVQQLIGWLPDDDLTVRENEIRLQRIVDWNIVGIAFGDDQGRITDANEAFLRIAGYTREEIETDAVSWPALMPVERHQRQVQALEEILTTGRCTPFDSEIIHSDGRRIPVVVSAARLSARKREGVAFVLDVSPYRQAETWLRTELAIADLLSDAASAEAVLPPVLSALCDGLGWVGAWVWTTDGGTLRPVAHHGTTRVRHSAVAALAGQVASSGEPAWAPADAALALPLDAAGRGPGVIVLIDESSEGPEQPRVSATRAIAGRIARTLAQKP